MVRLTLEEEQQWRDRFKHYPRAFRLGSLKKKGQSRQYIVWVNGGPPVSFPTKSERRAFILNTQILMEANDG